jgi:hypothetical protein
VEAEYSENHHTQEWSASEDQDLLQMLAHRHKGLAPSQTHQIFKGQQICWPFR